MLQALLNRVCEGTFKIHGKWNWGRRLAQRLGHLLECVHPISECLGLCSSSTSGLPLPASVHPERQSVMASPWAPTAHMEDPD